MLHMMTLSGFSIDNNGIEKPDHLFLSKQAIWKKKMSDSPGSMLASDKILLFHALHRPSF